MPRLVRATHAGLTGVLTVLVVADPGGRTRRHGGYHTYVTSLRSLDAVMRRVAPPLFLSTIAAGLGAAVVSARQDRSAAALRVLAAGLVAAAVRTTLQINDPINRRIRAWDIDTAPDDWQEQRAEWERGHQLRSTLMTASALATAAAARR